ncbi:MAG: zinc ribbon domain-containing protein [Asgard group archaeon]|nr:zinc ribbon domain-containing protein [Asgard group archaeon]
MVPVLKKDKFAKLISYCIGKSIPMDYPLRRVVEEEAAKKKFVPLGSFFLRGLDMDGVIALTLPKKESSDGLTHYLFVWFSKEDVSVSSEKANSTLQIKSVDPMHFSLRGSPETFVKVMGESSMIQSILVDLVDDLKCLESFTIYNKEGSQKDAQVEIPSDLIGSRFIVQTLVSEEATSPTHGKFERMEIALPQLIDLANYSIMTGLKMFGPMNEFTNFCAQCGQKLPPGKSAFCIHCGANLDKE